MWLKIVIVLLFLGILATLGGAFYTLIKDQGRKSKRTANLLAIRVGLAVLLLILVSWGVWSGNLGVSSPWYTP